MKSILKSTKDCVIKNRYFVVGFVAIVLYLFSNYFFDDYIVSYTNLTYRSEPFLYDNVVVKSFVKGRCG